MNPASNPLLKATRLPVFSSEDCYNIYSLTNNTKYNITYARQLKAEAGGAHQRGVALITAILVVALATIAATAILVSANVAIYRANNLQASEKAWWLADGVESWVKSILVRDAQENQTDSFEDLWAKKVILPPYDSNGETAFISGEVVDLQGLFNLNNLGVTDTQQYKKYADQFSRLAQQIDVDPFAATQLAAAIRDWIDADDQPTGLGGAEDTDYLSLQPAYRTPNRYLESVSEILAVKGMTKEIYAKLMQACPSRGKAGPCITTLPLLGTAININTAPEIVLRSMVTQPPNPQFESFVNDREQSPSSDVQNQQSAFDANSPPQTVKSQFFMLQAEAFIGSGRVALYSFYYRPSSGAPVVLGRSTDTP